MRIFQSLMPHLCRRLDAATSKQADGGIPSGRPFLTSRPYSAQVPALLPLASYAKAQGNATEPAPDAGSVPFVDDTPYFCLEDEHRLCPRLHVFVLPACQAPEGADFILMPGEDLPELTCPIAKKHGEGAKPHACRCGTCSCSRPCDACETLPQASNAASPDSGSGEEQEQAARTPSWKGKAQRAAGAARSLAQGLGKHLGGLAKAVLPASLIALGLKARDAWAASDLAGIAQNLTSNFSQLGQPIQVIFAVAGFFLVGNGLWQLYARSHQPGSPKGSALMGIVIGVCLLAAVAIVRVMSQTLGVDNPALSQIGIG